MSINEARIPRVFGYARISKARQNIERQMKNIKAEYPNATIYHEAYTGTKFDGRHEWNKLTKVVRTGDTIVFDSVSRMSRNADEGVALYMELMEKGVELVFLKERHIDTLVYKEAAKKQIDAIATGDEDTDALMKSIIDAINVFMVKLAEKQIRIAFDQAEKEVEDLHQRVKEGLQVAADAGRIGGNKTGDKLNVKKKAPAKEAIRKHSKTFGGTLDDNECMKIAGVSRATFYKYKNELKLELME